MDVKILQQNLRVQAAEINEEIIHLKGRLLEITRISAILTDIIEGEDPAAKE